MPKSYPAPTPVLFEKLNEHRRYVNGFLREIAETAENALLQTIDPEEALLIFEEAFADLKEESALLSRTEYDLYSRARKAQKGAC